MVGANDPESAAALDRLNRQATLLRKLNYPAAVNNLRRMAAELSGNSYALSRINNELADLLTNRTMEIEDAVEVDQQLLASPIPDKDAATGQDMYFPRSIPAVNRLLLDKDHFQEYVAVDAAAVKDRAQSRLEANLLLLNGRVQPQKAAYTKAFLEETLGKVRADIGVTYPGTADRQRFQSRLVRVDYELTRLTGQSTGAYNLFLTGEIKIANVDFGEINFLELSDYFSRIFKNTGDIRMAESALQVVYLPYLNLRNPNYRWNYNKLINDYISTLIEANYKAGRFDEMLYYISLNKSRMLLEERLAYAKGGGSVEVKVSDLTVNDGIPRTSSGLPEKTWFKQRLAAAGPYIDFYVGGKYMAQSTSAGQKLAQLDRSTMPLTTRDFGVEDASIQADAFVDDVLYVTEVNGGKIVAAKKVSGKQLEELKGQLDSSYQKIASGARQGYAQSPFLKTLMAESGLPEKIVISPDKWLARHPMDFHLGAKATRSVNFFTVGGDDHLANLRVSGFFNPTLDLNGAEEEADAIRTYIPDAQIFKREAAQLSALQSVANASVLHLSTHGQFDANDPRNSRLVFAGAIRGAKITSDPNSLYARDMYKYAALKDRDLIFAAACQTGLSAAGQENENELMGILRPLTANRNRNIILSLWKVDDMATKEFVAAFYQRLAETKDVDVAFHHAQDVVRGKYSQPYYWAAFYLSKSN